MDPVNSGPFYPGNRVRLTPEGLEELRRRDYRLPREVELVVRTHRSPWPGGRAWYMVDNPATGHVYDLEETFMERVR